MPRSVIKDSLKTLSNQLSFSDKTLSRFVILFKALDTIHWEFWQAVHPQDPINLVCLVQRYCADLPPTVVFFS